MPRASRHRRKYWIGLLIAVLGILLYSVFGDRGLIHIYHLKQELRAITIENERLRRENAELKAEIHLLRTDKKYIEKLAREKLGMTKSDEIIFQFKEDKKKAQNPQEP